MGRTASHGAALHTWPERRPRLVAALFALVFVVWASGMVASLTGEEPYPALTQPRFPTVHDEDGVVRATAVSFRVRLADGRVTTVEPERFLPASAGQELSLARSVLTPASTRDPATRAWLAQRFTRLDLGAAAQTLVVLRTTLTYRGPDDLSRGRPRVWFRVPLGPPT